MPGFLGDVSQDVPVLFVRLLLRPVQNAVSEINFLDVCRVRPFHDVGEDRIGDVLAHLVV